MSPSPTARPSSGSATALVHMIRHICGAESALLAKAIVVPAPGGSTSRRARACDLSSADGRRRSARRGSQWLRERSRGGATDAVDATFVGVTTGRLALVASISVLGALAVRATREPRTTRSRGRPPAAAVERGRQAASRFGLRTLHEVTVEVDNVFAAANRQALSLAEQRLREVPGVRGCSAPPACSTSASTRAARPARARCWRAARARAKAKPPGSGSCGAPTPSAGS